MGLAWSDQNALVLGLDEMDGGLRPLMDEMDRARGILLQLLQRPRFADTIRITTFRRSHDDFHRSA